MSSCPCFCLAAPSLLRQVEPKGDKSTASKGSKSKAMDKDKGGYKKGGKDDREAVAAPVEDKGIDIKELSKAIAKLQRAEKVANAPAGASLVEDPTKKKKKKKGKKGKKGDGEEVQGEEIEAKDGEAPEEGEDGGGLGDGDDRAATASELGLPMREIGEGSGAGKNAAWAVGGPRCFHGAMQEAR